MIERKYITKEEALKYWLEKPLSEGFFAPPWNPNEHPEKTEGWIEFQRAMWKDPKYYLGEFFHDS